MPRTTDRFLEPHPLHPLVKIALWAVMIWTSLLMLMWAGYLFLSFFNVIPGNPVTQVPQVPFVPGFNDNLPTTVTTTTWVPSG